MLQNAGYRVVTYDRRGFGRSDKPMRGYIYDTLTEDLHALLEQLDLRDVTLVGFSMGGGEVARYFSLYRCDRLHSVVFASAVPPYLMHTSNPDGPLTGSSTPAFENESQSVSDDDPTEMRQPSTTPSPNTSSATPSKAPTAVG
jgi:pimeloyl-ACP methyl ester carboxylesterase